MKLRQFNVATNSIFGMFGVFLRRDLAINYIHHEKVFFYGAETLAYVIQPQLLLKYKKSLIEDCMFVLDDKDEWEFNLLENARYHPNERIEFLKMLTNSTTFAQGFLHHLHAETTHARIELIKIIVRLIDSFHNFKNDWMLDEYQDLKGNNEKQKEIYQLFKYYIQFLFGIAEFFVDKSQKTPATNFTPRYKTIIDASTNGICDSSGLNIGAPSDNGFKFIDLSDDMIKNDRDLEYFVDTLKHSRKNHNVEHITYNLEYPQYNHLMNQLILHTKPNVTIPELTFDAVSNIYKFLQRKWNYK